MKALLYQDSPEYYKLYASTINGTFTKDVLLISHDLSESGAPRVLLNIAEILIANGCFVTVISPLDGPVRSKLIKAGCAVVVDELALSAHKSVIDFAKNYDFVIGNTILSAQTTSVVACYTNTCIYIHETDVLIDLLKEVKVVEQLKSIKNVLVGSPISQNILKNNEIDAQLMHYGIDAISKVKSIKSDDIIRIGVFGSYESRKGQDLLLNAYKSLSIELKEKIKIEMYGRILDQHFLNH